MMKVEKPPGFFEVRFFAKVERGLGEDDCWIYTAAPSQIYGVFKLNGRWMKAHRVSYEMHYGPIPEGLLVCHKCDNPRCVRPDHLFLGTTADNARDSVNKGRDYFSRPESDATRPRGELHPRHLDPERYSGELNAHAKLTAAQVAEIRRRYASGGVSQSQLAKAYGVGQTTISAIVRRVNWHE